MTKLILDHVDDLVSDFLYYDRKECEQLPMGAIEDAIISGNVTVDAIVDKFRSSLISGMSLAISKTYITK